MADLKISQLAQANVVNKDDLFYLIQDDLDKNLKASTLFENITDPILAGNIIFGGTPQVLNAAGTVSITTTRTDLYGGVPANVNAIANGTILPSSIYLYTEGVSATGRGVGFTSGTAVNQRLYVSYKDNKINMARGQLISSYPPEEWVGSDGLRPFPTGLNFIKGSTYTFDLSHPTNSGNTFALSTSIDGTNTQGARYTANIATNGTPGTAGANIVFTVPNVSTDPGGRTFLDFPTGVDGQLKVVNLVRTSGGSFVISSNLQNNISLELRKSGDSALMMYSSNGWVLVGSSPGVSTTFSGTSDDIPEGQKLYFTNTRARAAISAGDNTIIYDPVAGTIKANLSINISGQDVALGNTIVTGNLTVQNYIKANGLSLQGIDVTNTILAGNIVSQSSTSNVISANTITANVWNNLYTANVKESASNLYYTNTRVYANVIALLPTLAGNNIIIAANGQISANAAGIAAAVSSISGNLAVSGNINTSGVYTNIVSANIWNNIYTANVIESASNLYYTNARVYANVIGLIGGKANIVDLTTANVIESASNLYFTNARVYSNISPLLAFKANIADLTTANVIESLNNLYYTNARVYSALSGGTGVSYNNITGAISIGQNVSTTSSVTFANLTVTGQTTFYGNITTHTSNNLSISDNMIYLNSGSETSNPDLGFAGNYNDGTYHHAGFFRDASDAGTWKVFENYSPEPDSNIFINTDHATFRLANLAVTTLYGNVTGTVSTLSNFTTSNLTEGNNLYFTNTRVRDYLEYGTGNLIPAIGNLYDIGSESRPWRDLWLGGTSIRFANSTTVSSVANTFTITNAAGNVIFEANATNIPITSTTGKLTANLLESVPNYSTSNITEGTNLYFTNTRAQLALQPTLAELRASLNSPVSNVIYVAGNGNDNNTGNSQANALANIHVALARATEWTTVFVKSGDYTLYNQPVTIGKRVGLVGDNLRTTTIRPSQPAVDMFYVNNACYVTGFTFRDHVAPSAVFSYNPDGSAGVIVTSPYIQNSSSITTTGTGMRVDGRYVRGLRSMVCDSYTQTNEGGIGIHMLHRGYTQLVSVFTICCNIAIKCESGGFCSITNSNASFGTYALYADGVSEPLYFGKLTQDTIGQDFVITNLEQRPNYGDSVLFADFNESKCSRDTGLIVDALAFDLAYQGNSQSNFAGLQYWSQTSSAIPNQATETLAAINYAKDLAYNVAGNVRISSPYQVANVQQFAANPTLVSDVTSSQKIVEEFELIANIISNGTVGVTDRIVTNNLLATTNVYANHASNLLYRNNAFIASEVVAFVNATYPGFTYDSNICARDVGYMLDSVRFDLLHGGNRQAIQAGTYYYNYSTDTSQINNQVVQTGAAYDFIGTIIGNIITATAVTPTYPQYNVAKCTRDAGLIVDSLGIDLAYDSNTQATFAGLQYWAQTSSAIPSQSEETLAAIAYAKNLSTNVASNTTITGLYQTNVTQTFNALTGTAVEANVIASGFNLISNIIASGTVGITDRIVPNNYAANTAAAVQQAANLLLLNKTFIATEVFAFVNATYPGFFANANNFVDFTNAGTKCQRDVGYMIESVTFDLLHGGNRQAVQAGTYYYNYSSNTTQINNEIVQTSRAYQFISSLLPNILTNTAVTYKYQNAVSQNTTAATAATLNEVYTINRDISLISNIIINGPSSAPPKISITNTANTNSNVVNATKILFANKDFIVAELIAYTNQIIFDLPAGNLLTQNTTAAPASTIATANVILENINLITNIIAQGPSVAAPKRPIGLTISNDANLVNAATLMIANKDFIKAEVLDYVKTNWATISNGAGTFYTVKNATELANGTSTVTLLETVFETIHANSSVSFHQGSYISSSGHTFEYVGAGDTIATALPYLGGIPKQENEITELRGGKVFFTSTDQRGDFRIGTGLVINRVDGTISGRTFNKALFAVMTPYMLAIEG